MLRSKLPGFAWVTAVVVLAAGLGLAVWRPDGAQPLVVYCAHDAVFADAILQEFTRQTGIPLSIRYDTEATKSLGLVQLIQKERQQPRCDVFWNNELLGTLDLAEQELLEPYRGSGWQRMPEVYRDPQGRWTGFAARLRVWMIDADSDAAGLDETALDEYVKSHSSTVAMAQPLFGTTLTHYTVCQQAWGDAALQQWHRTLRAQGLREVPGNALVKDLVAQGSCAVGATDTDDYFAALDAGARVQMQPIRVAGETICIPNTVCIVKGSRQTEFAQKLVDYLTSSATELRLARSASRQIPIGKPDVGTEWPDDVRPLIGWAQEGVDLRPLLPVRRAVVDWLTSESLR
jgi:iron(III) transport system substrate-binding protein